MKSKKSETATTDQRIGVAILFFSLFALLFHFEDPSFFIKNQIPGADVALTWFFVFAAIAGVILFFSNDLFTFVVFVLGYGFALLGIWKILATEYIFWPVISMIVGVIFLVLFFYSAIGGFEE
jgi:hypothetical protein